MAAPTFAIVAGYMNVFVRMQFMMAVLSGATFWLASWCLVAFVYGRIYCSTVCPLGTLMDCVSFVGMRFPRRSRYNYRQPLHGMRLFFLFLVLGCILAGWVLLPSFLDPYSAYARIVKQFFAYPFRGYADGVRFSLVSFSVAAFTAAVTVGVAWRRGRTLCNTICPVGTLFGVIAKKSLLHADINTDKCINCGECERVCKSECINLMDHTVDTSRCVVCFNCMSVCPNNAITYRKGRHRLRTPLMQPIGDKPFSAVGEQPSSTTTMQ